MMAVGSCRGSSQGEEERTRPWTGEQRAPSPESEGWGGVRRETERARQSEPSQQRGAAVSRVRQSDTSDIRVQESQE